EPMGDWVLRSAQGWTNRANSVLPLGDPGQPLDAAIQACVRWYQAQGLPAVINVALPLRRDLAHRLAELGWHGLPVVLVQTANLADLPSTLDPEPGPDPATGARIDLTGQPSQAFLELVAQRKQGLPETAHQVLTGVEQLRFAEAARAGQVLAIARGAVVERWLHLSLVEVIESARRQRLAQRITLALAHWAAGAGATRAVLQVEERNLPAVSFYRRLGFRTHHRYVSYLAPEPPTGPPS
ncbi:MAG TPA: GNAT family N-acetyltransferase, partial [Micromonosporaceae bacterium]